MSNCRTETALTHSKLAERLIGVISQATLFGLPKSQSELSVQGTYHQLNVHK